MKTQLIVIFLAAAFSATAFASNHQSSVEVKGSSSAINEGFESWAKSLSKYDGPSGQGLAGEVQSWVAKSKQIGNKH